MDYPGALRFRRAGCSRLLRREKVDAIQRRDDFAANEQFLQIIAVTQLFVAEDAKPKIRRRNFSLS
jgi:hypothetical protein